MKYKNGSSIYQQNIALCRRFDNNSIFIDVFKFARPTREVLSTRHIWYDWRQPKHNFLLMKTPQRSRKIGDGGKFYFRTIWRWHLILKLIWRLLYVCVTAWINVKVQKDNLVSWWFHKTIGWKFISCNCAADAKSVILHTAVMSASSYLITGHHSNKTLMFIF